MWNSACLLVMAFSAAPDAWPSFLGQGAAPIDPATIPLVWTPQENVAWSTRLPGKGQSSPVIWGDKVFVTSIDGTMKDRCHITALSLKDGSVLWTRTIKPEQTVRSNYFQSRSAPTPAVDAHAVYAFFETGNLVAFTHAGEQKWERILTKDFGAFESTIGLATSPLLTDDAVVLLIDHEGPSYLLAVDRRTGETRWKTDRESRVSYASPALVPVGEKQHIVCSSAGSVDGYDPKTGEALWSYSEQIGGNRSATPLPLGNGRFVIAASPGMHNENEAEARQSNGVMAIDRTEAGYAPRVLWRTTEAMPSFSTPLIHRGLAYWVNRAGIVFCFNAETGEKHYAKRIGQGCWATPVGLGERIYVFGKDGLTTVLKAGPEFEILAENPLWDPATTGDESGQRNRAAGRPVEGSPAPAEGNRPAATEKSPASAPPEGAPATGTGRPPRSPEATQQARDQGENRFADHVQYGVAIVNGHLVIRTGDSIYCVRTAAKATTEPQP